MMRPKGRELHTSAARHEMHPDEYLVPLGRRGRGGAFLGGLMAGYIDLLPGYLATGATAGLVTCGLAGLLWPSRASRSTLVILAVGVAAMGIMSALVIHHLYLTTWNAGMQVLVALDAVFVSFLCLVQPIRAMTPSQPDR